MNDLTVAICIPAVARLALSGLPFLPLHLPPPIHFAPARAAAPLRVVAGGMREPPMHARGMLGAATGELVVAASRRHRRRRIRNGIDFDELRKPRKDPKAEAERLRLVSGRSCCSTHADS